MSFCVDDTLGTFITFMSTVCRNVAATYNAVSVPFLINKLQARDKMSEMQMMAAKCLTHLFCSGSMPSSETVIKLAVGWFSHFFENFVMFAAYHLTVC